MGEIKSYLVSILIVLSARLLEEEKTKKDGSIGYCTPLALQY
jgi:hypothetical protein